MTKNFMGYGVIQYQILCVPMRPGTTLNGNDDKTKCQCMAYCENCEIFIGSTEF